MRLGLVQMRSGRSLDQNVEAAATFISDAASQGARYVQTPEMTTLVERDRKRLAAEITADACARAADRFSQLAARHKTWLHIGSMAVPVADGRFANRAHLFAPDGRLSATYDKIHMFDVDLDNGESWRESAIYAPGDSSVVASLTDGSEEVQVGLGICYDLRFAALFRQQAQAGADLLTMPAAFTRQTGEAHWHVLLRARAIETGSYVAAAAQGGLHEDGRETYGHSLVIDPWGSVVGEKADDEPGVLFADIDVGQVAAARQKIPALQHDRAFEVTSASEKTDSDRAVA
ncbi:MAG: carbon-nitrogen hydrolase family protein [Cohaesibacteraceae bacterium]